MNKNELFSQVSKLLNEYIESNIPEPKVIVRFWIVGVVLMLISLASLKIR